jgi:hypothetical protein
MVIHDFEGVEYGYTFNIATGTITLYTKGEIKPAMLDVEETRLFRNHLELLNSKPEDTLNQRTEKIVQIYYYFKTKPCPMPHFVE